VKRFVAIGWIVLLGLGGIIWGALGLRKLSDERVRAEAAADEAREAAAFERGKLEAMCTNYCSNPELTWMILAEPSIDRMEGHVFAIDDEPEHCHCVLVDMPSRRDPEP
jgi:hypothetical protein